MIDDNAAFRAAGSKLKNAKDYFSVVNPPLLIGRREDLVLLLVPPPGLHLLLRSTNHIWVKLEELWVEYVTDETPEDQPTPPNPAEEFAKSIYMVRAEYHGGEFEGNQCERLLKNTEKLRQALPLHLHSYADCLESLKKVVDSTFSAHLDLNYPKYFQDFDNNYKKLKISVTPSVHAIITHVPQFIQMEGNKQGLSLYAEQAGETAHSDWNDAWLSYKYPITHPKYGSQLLRSVGKYNSRHW